MSLGWRGIVLWSVATGRVLPRWRTICPDPCCIWRAVALRVIFVVSVLCPVLMCTRVAGAASGVHGLMTILAAAAGKSSFLEIVDGAFPGHHVLQEPISRWTNVCHVRVPPLARDAVPLPTRVLCSVEATTATATGRG